MSKPWECPVCHRGCAPDVKTCDHGGESVAPSELRLGEPYWVYWPWRMPGEPWRVGDITCGSLTDSRLGAKYPGVAFNSGDSFDVQ